jgi:hypothetical protein
MNDRNSNHGDKPMAQTANKPVKEVRLGHIKAAIWANETQSGTRHNVTVTRLYKDGTQWKSSDSFGRDDLPLVQKVCDLAHSWIFQEGQNREE